MGYRIGEKVVVDNRPAKVVDIRDGNIVVKSYDGYQLTIRPGQEDRISREKFGSVCGKCGKTVTEAEYSSGESKCCKDEVVAEEFYGRPAPSWYQRTDE